MRTPFWGSHCAWASFCVALSWCVNSVTGDILHNPTWAELSAILEPGSQSACVLVTTTTSPLPRAESLPHATSNQSPRTNWSMSTGARSTTRVNPNTIIVYVNTRVNFKGWMDRFVCLLKVCLSCNGWDEHITFLHLFFTQLVHLFEEKKTY